MSEPSSLDTGTGAAPDPRLHRVLRAAGTPGLMSALTERLSPTDLRTLLLAVLRRRAAAVTPGRLLERYERDRFSVPSAVDPLELARLDVLIHERLADHGFAGVEPSPVCPLGTNSAVATVDQNKVLTTVRGTEVVADTTNVLALECAVRRRRLLRADARSRQWIRLGATQRVVRAQAFAVPGLTAHFKLLGLCTAGRDEGSFGFETAALAEQIHLQLDVLDRACELGHRTSAVRVTVTDLTGGRHRRALSERVLDRLARAHPSTTFDLDDERSRGRGYYTGGCFEIRATTPDGDELSIGDGGFTTWTADLLSNAKERLLISGLGLEHLCGRFREKADAADLGG
ncbi:MAG: hypothetical protein ACRDOO_14795 [Actinomadura sp.]